jgi:hypothetical protein
VVSPTAWFAQWVGHPSFSVARVKKMNWSWFFNVRTFCMGWHVPTRTHKSMHFHTMDQASLRKRLRWTIVATTMIFLGIQAWNAAAAMCNTGAQVALLAAGLTEIVGGMTVVAFGVTVAASQPH